MKYFLSILLLFSIASASAQNNLIWGKTVQATERFQLKNVTVKSISKDSTSPYGADTSLMTERAIKAFLRGYSGGGGGGIDTGAVVAWTRGTPPADTLLILIHRNGRLDTIPYSNVDLYGKLSDARIISGNFWIYRTSPHGTDSTNLGAIGGGGGIGTETDPVYTASAAAGISGTNITNWNSAYGWGNHSGLYPLLSGSYTNPSWINSLAWSKISGVPSFLTTETDPVYSASSWFSTTNNSSNWNTAFGWGNHTGLYPLLLGSYSNPSWINTLAWSKITGAPAFLTTETDPVYSASSWFSTTNSSSNWNTAFGWGNHASAGYLTSATAAINYEPKITAPNSIKRYLTGYKTFAAFNTDSIGVEGSTNLWYTDARARAALSVTGSGISYNSTTGLFTFSGGGSSGTTNVDSTLKANNLFGFTVANAIGDSYTKAIVGLNSPSEMYVSRLGTKNSFTVINRGVNSATSNMLNWIFNKWVPVTNNTQAIFSLFGFNDARLSGDNYKLYNKIRNVYRSGIASQFMSTATAANDASLTKTGTWSTVNTFTLYGGKAPSISSGLGQTTSTTNDQITYSTTSDNIVIGYIGGDGVNKSLGSFTVTVGSITDTIQCNNQTDGISVSTGDSATFYGIPCVKILSGLGTSSKSVTIKNLGGEIIIDYVGTLKTDASTCAPFFATSTQKTNDFGWAISGYAKGANYIVDKMNAQIKLAIAEVKVHNKNFPAYYVDVNKYIDNRQDIYSDSIHWNPQGQYKAFLAYDNFLNQPLSKYGAIDQPEIITDLRNFSQITKSSTGNNFNMTYQGLTALTTGTDNIGVGVEVLKLNTTGTQNTAVGNYALSNNLTGSTNVGLGHYTMYNLRSGSNNMAIGYSALQAHRANNGNTAVGANSMYTDTSGNDNTAVGVNSLYFNLRGTYNTAIGSGSMTNNTTGLYNTAMGYNSLTGNLTGQQNVSIGMGSLQASLGTGNIGLGYNAGYQVTSGGSNIVIGYNTGAGLTTGSNNTIVGSGITGLTAAMANNVIISDGQGNKILWSNVNHVTSLYSGAAVASAATITPTGNLFHVTGTTSVTSVSGTLVAAGAKITIIFDGVLTFTDGSNLKLNGNFTTAADATITLIYDGTNWYEITRSQN